MFIWLVVIADIQSESMAIAFEAFHPVINLRGKRYNAFPIDGDRFAQFMKDCLVPHLLPFNRVNPRSVVRMDNASIHHIEAVTDSIETLAGAFCHPTQGTCKTWTLDSGLD